MASISDEQIKKRLKSVNPTQDSVQTTSMWILQHRESSIDKIAKCWMDVYKEASDNLRVALIYVMNDVVQKANKKDNSNSVTLTFHPHLINAIGMANLNVKKAISRCVEVFEQRHVFPSHIIDEMKAALVSRIATEKDDKDSGEIDHTVLIRSIESFKQNETLTEKARDILAKSDFNIRSSIEGRVKDRTEGKKVLADIDSSRQKLVIFLNSVEKHQQKGLKLIDMLGQVKTSFNLQLRDVTVVNDAYEKFANGIRETRKELELMIKAGVEPDPDASPPRDAPSPTAFDDPFINGIDENGANEGEDMEMDEEDIPGTSHNSGLIQPKDYIVPIQIPQVPSTLDPRLQRILEQTRGIHPRHQQNQQYHSSQDPGIAARNAAMDPRQRSRLQQQGIPTAPPMSDDPSRQNTSLQQQLQMPRSMASITTPMGMGPPSSTSKPPTPTMPPQGLRIDTSLPPPNLFSPGSTSGSNPVSPAAPFFNPNNPPPTFHHPTSMSVPPGLVPPISSSPNNFTTIPLPANTAHPPPNFTPMQPPPGGGFMARTPGIGGIHRPSSMMNSNGSTVTSPEAPENQFQKRRASSFTASGSDDQPYPPKRGNWRGGSNQHGQGRGSFNNNNHANSARGGGQQRWRNSFGGGSANDWSKR